MKYRSLENSAAQIDFETISLRYFHTKEAAGALDSIIRETAAQQQGSRSRGRPYDRRRKLDSLRRAAQKVVDRLDELDPQTRLELFGAIPGGPAAVVPATPPMALGAARGDVNEAVGPHLTNRAIQNFESCNTLLAGLNAAAATLIDSIPPQKAGAPQAEDAILFGVQSLASVWMRHRADTPTSGIKRGGFGSFALELLCNPPVRASHTAVLSALRHAFKTSATDR